MGRNKKDRSVQRWILRSVRPDWYGLILLAFLRAVQAVLLTLISLSLRGLVDAAVAQEQAGFERSFLLLALLIAGEVAAYFAGRYVNGIFAARMEIRLRKASFQTLMQRSYAQIAKVHSGEWAGRIITGCRIVSQSLIQLIPAFIGVVVQLAAAMFAMHVILPQSTPVIVIALILMALCAAALRNRLVYCHKEIVRHDSRAAGLLQEQIANTAVIRSFSGEAQSVRYMGKAFDDVLAARKDWTKIMAVSTGGIHLASQGAYLIGAAACCFLLFRGTMTAGTMTAMISLVQQIAAPLSGAFSVVPNYYAMVGSAEQLKEIENLPADREMEPLSDTQIREIYEKELSAFGLQSVTFSYEGGKPVVQDLSLMIRKGEFAALTGGSGSGKTTILKLLMCLYAPDEGHRVICFRNGEEGVLDASFRRLFAYIPQENGLLSGTIREGLQLGCDRDIPDEEIWEALRCACADSFVRAADGGIDASLGERGSGFSEGQMQRLAVARALLSGRPVLLLDEATSALDEETEQKLLDNLKGLPGRTVIAVTHRPYAARIADVRISLDGKTV